MRTPLLVVFAVMVTAGPVFAAPVDGPPSLFASPALARPWHISWLPDEPAGPADGRVPLRLAPLEQSDTPAVHAAAVEHSDAYELRRKIHRGASFATLPLFAAELALGQSLYNTTDTSNGAKTAHGIVGAAIMGLFAVNTVTGSWNLFGEDRHDPNGRGRRMLHGLLMMAADAGFVATTASAPGGGRRDAAQVAAGKVTHRNLAIASIGIATAGYLVMIVPIP